MTKTFQNFLENPIQIIIDVGVKNLCDPYTLNASFRKIHLRVPWISWIPCISWISWIHGWTPSSTNLPKKCHVSALFSDSKIQKNVGTFTLFVNKFCKRTRFAYSCYATFCVIWYKYFVLMEIIIANVFILLISEQYHER